MLDQLQVYRAAALSWLALVSQERPWLPVGPFALAALWALLFLVWVRAPRQGPFPKSATLWQRMYHRLWYRRLLGTRGLHSDRYGWWVALPLGALMVPAIVAYVLGQDSPTAKALELSQKISIVLTR